MEEIQIIPSIKFISSHKKKIISIIHTKSIIIILLCFRRMSDGIVLRTQFGSSPQDPSIISAGPSILSLPSLARKKNKYLYQYIPFGLLLVLLLIILIHCRSYSCKNLFFFFSDRYFWREHPHFAINHWKIVHHLH